MRVLTLLFCTVVALANDASAAGAPHLNGDDKFCVTFPQQITDGNITITNNCGKPVEMQYCLHPDPRFDSGDIHRTCATEGVRTTGRLAPGASIVILTKVTRPYNSKDRSSAYLWMNLCDASNKNLKCKIPPDNPVFNPYHAKENYKYKLLTAAKSRELEQQSIGKISDGSLNGPETESSMCQGDTNGLAGYWPIGRFVAAEEAGMSGMKVLIESSTESISYHQEQADKSETITKTMEDARMHRQIAEFLECHQANNWPAIHWLQNAWNICKKDSAGLDPDTCIANLARKYHRLGVI